MCTIVNTANTKLDSGWVRCCYTIMYHSVVNVYSELYRIYLARLVGDFRPSHQSKKPIYIILYIYLRDVQLKIANVKNCNFCQFCQIQWPPLYYGIQCQCNQCLQNIHSVRDEKITLFINSGNKYQFIHTNIS